MKTKSYPVPAGEMPEKMELVLVATATSESNPGAERQIWANKDWGVTCVAERTSAKGPLLSTFMMKSMPGHQYKSYDRMRFAYAKHVLGG